MLQKPKDSLKACFENVTIFMIKLCISCHFRLLKVFLKLFILNLNHVKLLDDQTQLPESHTILLHVDLWFVTSLPKITCDMKYYCMHIIIL